MLSLKLVKGAILQTSGFTFIKNGLTLGYPILESVLSIEPLCDEVVINVGFNNPECTEDDGTEEYLRDNLTGSKYKFIKSWWDPNIQKSGLILSQQTNIALDQCRGKACQYIQGDEVLHEDDLVNIENGIKELIDRNDLEALVYNYIHFFGNVDIYKYTRTIYRREVRTVKNGTGIRSHLDAQGFRFPDGRKPFAKLIDARIFHYGWARSEQVMAKKIKSFDKLYHGKDYESSEDWSYKKVFGLKQFKDTHPKLMAKWIEENRNDLSLDSLESDFRMKHIRMAISDYIESLTGYRIGEFKNYKLVK
ncbi:hypothetical protein [Bacteriovorax sp. DB6_IX]|uniref:hypothetical protein n=1 Tax=Bacteriovorax sp. DB6_IX TaxID=1353530 RepID=UPI0004224BE5|nr:hypothetical protein [Bacteriovorax sp. DB6_IX]